MVGATSAALATVSTPVAWMPCRSKSSWSRRHALPGLRRGSAPVRRWRLRAQYGSRQVSRSRSLSGWISRHRRDRPCRTELISIFCSAAVRCMRSSRPCGTARSEHRGLRRRSQRCGASSPRARRRRRGLPPARYDDAASFVGWVAGVSRVAALVDSAARAATCRTRSLHITLGRNGPWNSMNYRQPSSGRQLHVERLRWLPQMESARRSERRSPTSPSPRTIP